MTGATIPIDQIFWQAAQLAGEARDAYLAEACGGDADLRLRVKQLLQVQPKISAFLEQPFAEPIAACEAPGSVIGPYKLLEQIGEGGMGLVFMAEQSAPIRRMVALKVLKPGMDTREVVARFEVERQALALMDHPNIARIFDAGTTGPNPKSESRNPKQIRSTKSEAQDQADGQVSDIGASNFGFVSDFDTRASDFRSGRPYFVMELVKGVPISDFCDQHRLTTRQRLELFVTVCQAVQHAHQKGIIHRDLKPGNVLVTLHDTVAVPKVIDFGIAKATGQRLTEQTLFTHFAQVLGSPLYMSPEQAQMNGLDVDTRSDIYSLGVMLYELLTGTTPFVKETLKAAGLDEMRRLIREEEPPRPSHRISTLSAEACSTVHAQRGVDNRRLSDLLRGELDWIVMKSLEKDRNRRYESASALAADVQRYLDDEPVEACPPSRSYRVRKFARRNRRTLIPAFVVALALVTATAVSIWQAAEAREAQRQAEADRTQSESDRKQADSERKKAEGAEKKAVTEAAIAKAVNEFLRVDLLGQASRAPANQAANGDTNLTVREALDRAASKIGERFKDQPLVEAAIRLAIGQAYISIREDQYALPHLERAVDLRKFHLGSDHEDTLTGMERLAAACSWTGRHEEAIALHQQILKNSETLHGPSQAETLACVSNLSSAYQLAGNLDESTRLREQLLDKLRAVNGPTHPQTLGIMHSLADNYTAQGHPHKALPLYEAVLTNRKSMHSPENQIFLRFCFAYACQQAGKLDDSERLLGEALAYSRKRKDSIGQITTANSLGWLARTLLLKEQCADAEPLVREALAIFEKERPNEQRRFYWVSLLGGVLLGQQKYADAEPLLLEGYEGIKSREATTAALGRERTVEVVERLVRFYEVTKQPEKARVWREKLSLEKARPSFAP